MHLGEARREVPFVINRVFALPSNDAVATLPSALLFEPIGFGASWVFSIQPVLPPVMATFHHVWRRRIWARAMTQSPELGVQLRTLFNPNDQATTNSLAKRLCRSGTYSSPLTQSRWRRTA